MTLALASFRLYIRSDFKDWRDWAHPASPDRALCGRLGEWRPHEATLRL